MSRETGGRPWRGWDTLVYGNVLVSVGRSVGPWIRKGHPPNTPPSYQYTCTLVRRTFPEAGDGTSIWDIENPTIPPFIFLLFRGVRLLVILLRPARGVVLLGTYTCNGQVPIIGGVRAVGVSRTVRRLVRQSVRRNETFEQSRRRRRRRNGVY